VTDIASNGNDQLKLDTTVAHSARLWNYLLGGKDNFAVDREAAQEVLAYMPELVQSARFNREFLGRAVRYLAGETDIRQYLDIGTDCRPRTTPTRWPRRPPRTAVSSMSTTTRWCSCTRGRC
jgi:hypothetical protein